MSLRQALEAFISQNAFLCQVSPDGSDVLLADARLQPTAVRVVAVGVPRSQRKVGGVQADQWVASLAEVRMQARPPVLLGRGDHGRAHGITLL